LRPERAVRHFKRSLGVPFSMEIIIVMSWSIWNERNLWIFNIEDPWVQKYMITFKKEFIMVIHRAKRLIVLQDMETWLHSIV
jgi:hypothetical protein